MNEIYQQTLKLHFGPDTDYTVTLSPADLADLSRDAARTWLQREFDRLGCTPSNPVGKVPVADMVLCIARSAGEATFRRGGPWPQQFAVASLIALDQHQVSLDLGAFAFA